MDSTCLLYTSEGNITGCYGVEKLTTYILKIAFIFNASFVQLLVQIQICSHKAVSYTHLDVYKRQLTDYVGTLDSEQLETVLFILREHLGVFVTDAVEAP